MRKMVVAALFALYAPVAVFVGAGLPTTAIAQEQKIGPEVGKPLLAAQDAMKKKRWPEALAKIKEAQAVANKTAYEQYQINELQGFVLMKQGDLANAARVFEQNLNSGQMSPAEAQARLKVLTQLNFQVKNYPKTIEFGNRWIKSSSAPDTEAYLLVAQAYYLTKDHRNTIRAAQAAIEAARRANQPVKENLLQLKLASQNAIGDEAGEIDTYQQLVRSFPKSDYWKTLLEMLKRGTDDDRLTLNFYRLMFDLDVLTKPSDYVEMAQMNMDRENNVPGEALQVMERGFSNKILENQDKARHERVLNAARTQSQAMQKTLAQLDQSARASQTGGTDVYLGAVYLSYGRPKEAVEAIRRGIQKGGLKNSDDAQLLLGRAYLKLGEKEEARKAFKAVPGKSPLARIADLWAIRSQQA